MDRDPGYIWLQPLIHTIASRGVVARYPAEGWGAERRAGERSAAGERRAEVHGKCREGRVGCGGGAEEVQRRSRATP